jgi:hypothetical protein
MVGPGRADIEGVVSLVPSSPPGDRSHRRRSARHARRRQAVCCVADRPGRSRDAWSHFRRRERHRQSAAPARVATRASTNSARRSSSCRRCRSFQASISPSLWPVGATTYGPKSDVEGIPDDDRDARATCSGPCRAERWAGHRSLMTRRGPWNRHPVRNLAAGPHCRTGSSCGWSPKETESRSQAAGCGGALAGSDSGWKTATATNRNRRRARESSVLAPPILLSPVAPARVRQPAASSFRRPADAGSRSFSPL